MGYPTKIQFPVLSSLLMLSSCHMLSSFLHHLENFLTFLLLTPAQFFLTV